MSEADGALRVVIWVPDGLCSRHWVHGCQFVAGDFELRRSPAEGRVGPDWRGRAAANGGAGAPAAGGAAGPRAGRVGEDGTPGPRAAAEQADPVGKFGAQEEGPSRRWATTGGPAGWFEAQENGISPQRPAAIAEQGGGPGRTAVAERTGLPEGAE